MSVATQSKQQYCVTALPMVQTASRKQAALQTHQLLQAVFCSVLRHAGRNTMQLVFNLSL